MQQSWVLGREALLQWNTGTWQGGTWCLYCYKKVRWINDQSMRWKIECWLCTYFAECRNNTFLNALIIEMHFHKTSPGTFVLPWDISGTLLEVVKLMLSLTRVFYSWGLWYILFGCWIKIFCHLYYLGSLSFSCSLGRCQAKFNTRYKGVVQHSHNEDVLLFSLTPIMASSGGFPLCWHHYSPCCRFELIQCTVIVWESRA